MRPEGAEERGACTICLEPDPPPIQRGCACRSDAGLAHVGCMVQAAEALESTSAQWAECSTCKQPFTGDMMRQLCRALAARARALPANHARRDVAMSLEIEVQMSDGQYEDAERAARKRHATLRATFGDEHEATLTAASKLSETLERQGKYEEAARIQHLVLEASRRVLGNESKLTIMTMGALADTLSQQGRHVDAERLFDQAVGISARVHGAEHTITLTLQGDCAKNLMRRGNHAKATDVLRRALASFARVLGAEHETTITVKQVLSCALCSLGKRDEAERLQRDVLAARTRLFGTEGAATLDSAEDLAGTLLQNGAYAEAERLWRGLLASRRSVLGAEHPSTLYAQGELVATVFRQERHEEAFGMQRLLAQATRRSGYPGPAHHSAILDMMRQLRRDRARSDEPVSVSKEAASILGARVALRAEHEATFGTVLSLAPDAQKDRPMYVVELDSGANVELRRRSMRVLCSGCEGASDAARACGRCRAAWYCSVACQKAHWPTHRLECTRGAS